MSHSMRNFFLAVLFLISAAGLVFSADVQKAQEAFAGAVKAYHEADHDQAIRLNEEVLSCGYFSSSVYYNLGNSYFKAGRLGKAVVNYIRALRLAPRDGDVQSNLSFARSVVENYAPWPRRSAFAPAGKFFSAPELQWLGFGLTALTGMLFLAGLFAGLRQKRLILGVGLLLIVSMYFVIAAVFQTIDISKDGVCVEKVEARFEPSAQATVYFKVPEGTEVKMLREKDGWIKIERADSKMGWVPAAALGRI